jgi:hypothetical protein
MDFLAFWTSTRPKVSLRLVQSVGGCLRVVAKYLRHLFVAGGRNAPQELLHPAESTAVLASCGNSAVGHGTDGLKGGLTRGLIRHRISITVQYLE